MSLRDDQLLDEAFSAACQHAHLVSAALELEGDEFTQVAGRSGHDDTKRRLAHCPANFATTGAKSSMWMSFTVT